jgi:hypothetical protein
LDERFSVEPHHRLRVTSNNRMSPVVKTSGDPRSPGQRRELGPFCRDRGAADKTAVTGLIEVAVYGSRAEGRQPRSRDTYVLIRCSEARADGSDYLAIHYHRDSTLHFDETARRDRGVATVVDRILQVLS